MGKITKIEVQKRNKERVNIFIDEEFAFALSAELVYKEGIKTGDILDVDKFTKISKEESYLKCKNSALRIIERACKSEKEIKEKLALKGYDNESIESTMEFLREYNFVNDENYAKMYVKDKIKNQGQNKIKYALIKKGIDEEYINEEMANIDNDEQMEMGYEIGLKKYNLLLKRESDKYKVSQKLYRFLISKGYGYDIVSSLVKKITKEEDY